MRNSSDEVGGTWIPGHAARGEDPDASRTTAPLGEATERGDLVRPIAVVVTLMAAFFLITSLWQMYRLDARVQTQPTLHLDAAMAMLAHDSTAGYSERLETARWWTLAELEANAMESRHRQGDSVLLFAVWIRYLGFVTGMILSLVGAMFVLGRLREPLTTVSGEGPGWKLSVLSSSPGLVLVILGSALMLTANLKQTQLHVADTQLFTGGWAGEQGVAPIGNQPGGVNVKQAADELHRAGAMAKHILDSLTVSGVTTE